MNIQIVSRFGSDLSSRKSASVLRSELLEALKRNESFVLDFSGVRTLSDSFADELFAILVVEMGESWFKSNVRVVNLDECVRDSILEAIQDRLGCAA